MPGRRGDLLVRALIWLVFLAMWAYQKSPAGDLLAIRPGLPRWIGAMLIGTGIGLYVSSAWSLAGVPRDAKGAPRILLAGGAYRYVRNPLYLSIATMAAGLSTAYGAWHAADLMRAGIVLLLAHLAVVLLEEPATRRRLGADYDEYCRRVPRWMPRRPTATAVNVIDPAAGTRVKGDGR